MPADAQPPEADGLLPPDRLLEAALAVTDATPLDWELLHRDLPGEAPLIHALEELSDIAAAYGADALDAEAAPQVPAHFLWGRLEARRLLGSGSYGEVWAAWDPGLQREVALKLRRETGASRRWLQEARRLAQVRHPNVVTVHGADEYEGRAGLWMDRLHGKTLEEMLEVLGPCSAREAAAIGIDLCAALAAVHAAGMIHGDMKTRNVLREGAPGHAGGAGRIVLMDFGSAHETSAREAEGSGGTPLFTPPELLRGGRSTAASDLYALGVVLYRLVTGRYPVEARTVEELAEKLDRREFASLRTRRPDLPPAFVTVVERSLDPDPARRFPDAAAMERALHAAVGLETVPRRSWPWAGRALKPAFAVLGLIALVSAVVLIPRWGRPWLARRAVKDLPSTRVVQDWVGKSVGGTLGMSIVKLSDWTGDGVSDLAVAAPGEVSGRGRVYIYRGGSDLGGAPVWTLEGERDGDHFGDALAASDLNGDGHPELIVGSSDSDRSAEDAGSAYVYRGGPGFDGRPHLVIDGRRAGQGLGTRLGSAGDVNGDGLSDLIVSAPTDDQAGLSAGRAYLFLGGKEMNERLALEFSLDIEGAQFGQGGARGIGDFNADGHDDFAIGASYAPAPAPRAGRVLIYFGGPGLDATPDLVLRGVGEDDFFGDLSAGGDLNADGHPDLVVGSLQADGLEPESGCAYIYFGGPRADAQVDLLLPGPKHYAFFGRWCDASTDFDRDGVADLIVGAPGVGGDSDSSGAVYVFLGGRGIDDIPDMVLRGSGSRTGFGTSPTALGDLHGDGFPDLAVGSPIDRRAAKGGGSVRVFDFARYHLIRPRAQDVWVAGRGGTVEWLGSTRADVAWSLDGGRSWKTGLKRAGGKAVNVATLAIPSADWPATDSLRVRINPSDHRLPGAGSQTVVRVQAADGSRGAGTGG